MRLPNAVLLFTMVAFSFGCGSSGAEKEKKKSDDESESADESPKKKDKKKKKEAKAEGSAEAEAKPTATATATAAAPTAEPAAPPPSNPLATFFTGEPDPAIKFLKQKQIPNQPVWIQVVPYWEANTDEPSPNDPYTTLELRGKDKHAYIGMQLDAPNPSMDAHRLSNYCAWASAGKCTFGAPVDGTLGQGLKMKIAEGTAEIMRKPARVWWMSGDVKGKELFVFVALRTDVWPKLEGEAFAMLKSMKVAGP